MDLTSQSPVECGRIMASEMNDHVNCGNLAYIIWPISDQKSWVGLDKNTSSWNDMSFSLIVPDWILLHSLGSIHDSNRFGMMNLLPYRWNEVE
jgi:hypothetical protein